jgi:hypothetical protein
MGFAVYVVLGGVLAALLANNVELQGAASGFEGTFADGVKAFVIGGAWTSFLAAIGYRSGSEKVDKQLEKAGLEAQERIKSLETEIDELFKSELDEVVMETDPEKRRERVRRCKHRLQNKTKLVRGDVENELDSVRRTYGRERGRLL